MKRGAAKDKELADNATLLPAWRAWHREQLEEALAGPHGTAVAQVVKFLDENMQSQSASALIALLHEHDWQQMSADVRFVVLHEINNAITKFRENTAFLIVKALLESGKSPPERSGNT